MADIRTDFTKDTPLFKGPTSTEMIIVELYKKSMNFKDIPSTDPILERASALDSKTVHAGAALADRKAFQSELADKAEAINFRIKQLEKSMKTADQDNGARFRASYESYMNSAAKLREWSQRLHEEFKKLQHHQRAEISELILHRYSNLSPVEVKRLLTDLEKGLIQFNKSIEELAWEQNSLMKNLDNLNENIMEKMPVTLREMRAPRTPPTETPPPALE